MADGPLVHPLKGDVLAGKYHVLRLLGEGGMGVVYEAMHQRLRERVAIKVLREAQRQSPDLVARFEREARMAAKLKSANVARIFDVDSLADGTPFIVMEFLEGRDLDAELGDRGPLPVVEGVGYVLQACSAVREAHARGIIHRDLKPQNLFLCGTGSDRRLKLLDFGISKLAEGDASVTATQSALGTPLYMSPEQIRSARRADVRSDIWSLGVILYEVLTGTTPFVGESPTAVVAAITADPIRPPQELRPEIPDTLSRVMLRALEKDPERRFQTVDELAEALAPFGVSGAWAPDPLTQSNPSNPIASSLLSAAPTLLAGDLPSSPGEMAAQPAATEFVEPAKPRKPAVWLAAGALVVVGVTSLLLFGLGQSAPGAEPIASGVALTPSAARESPSATAAIAPAVVPAPTPGLDPSASAIASRPKKPTLALPPVSSAPAVAVPSGKPASPTASEKPPHPTKPQPKDPDIPLTL